MINIGESYVVAYLMSNTDEYEDSQNQSRGMNMPYKLKLKIFPPYNLENPDVM